MKQSVSVIQLVCVVLQLVSVVLDCAKFVLFVFRCKICVLFIFRDISVNFCIIFVILFSLNSLIRNFTLRNQRFVLDYVKIKKSSV